MRTFTHGAALPGDLDRTEAVVGAGSGHAAPLARHTLAEGAVVLAPVLAVPHDAAVHVATGGTQRGEDGICGVGLGES